MTLRKAYSRPTHKTRHPEVRRETRVSKEIGRYTEIAYIGLHIYSICLLTHAKGQTYKQTYRQKNIHRQN